MKKILVTGAVGQIGTRADAGAAGEVRRRRGGGERRPLPQDPTLRDGGPFEFVDCLDPHHMTRVMQIHQVDTIYHLAALLSAVGELRPLQAWQLNVNGLVNMLEAAPPVRLRPLLPQLDRRFRPGHAAHGARRK